MQRLHRFITHLLQIYYINTLNYLHDYFKFTLNNLYVYFK